MAKRPGPANGPAGAYSRTLTASGCPSEKCNRALSPVKSTADLPPDVTPVPPFRSGRTSGSREVEHPPRLADAIQEYPRCGTAASADPASSHGPPRLELEGHAHHYRRRDPQNPDSRPD